MNIANPLLHLLDRKHHILVMLAAYVTGVILYAASAPFQIVLATILLSGLLYLVHWHGKRAVFLILCVLLAGGCRSWCVHHSYYEQQQRYGSNQTVSICGHVYKIEQKASGEVLYLDRLYDLSAGTMRGKVQVAGDVAEVKAGDRVCINGQVVHYEQASNDGEFDAALYYRNLGILFKVKTSVKPKILQRPDISFSDQLCCFQHRVSEVYEQAMNQMDAGILCTLILGNRSFLDPEVKEMYQIAGISHILAISGLHISILGYGVFRLLRRCKMTYGVSTLCAFLLVCAFTIMSGMGISAMRALLMFTCMLGAQVLGRTHDFMNGAALAAFILLVWNPYSLFQAGFLFSFTAIAGIGFASRILTYKYKKTDTIHEKIKKKMIKSILSAGLLQLWLLPLTAYFYYEVPVYSMFLNILVIGLSSYLIIFGLLGGVIGIWFPVCAKWFLLLCHWILKCYELLMNITVHLPFHTLVTGRPRGIWLLFYYIMLSVVMYGVNDKLYKDMKRDDLIHCECGGRVFEERSYGNNLLLAFLTVIAFLVLLLAWPKERNTLRVDFLDVGQGDGISITMAYDYHVFVDGGSTSKTQIGQYVLEPYLKSHGIRHVDTWILTHGDEDHMSGLVELLERGYPIDRILIAEVMPKDESWERLYLASKHAGTELYYVEAGDRIVKNDIELRCLAPNGNTEESDTDKMDRNDLSQVWLLTDNGHKMLLTGDISGTQESALCEAYDLSSLDVLKVAHHGSKYSSSEAFLQCTDPEVAVISCGAHNRYGHPHKETLDRLANQQSEVYMTKESGEIRINAAKGEWYLSCPCRE